MRGKWLLALVVVSMLVHCIDAASARQRKKAKLNRAWKTKQRECRNGECAGLEESEPNCTPKCVSPVCYDDVYGAEPVS